MANYAYTDARIIKLKEEGALKDLNMQRPSTPRHAANFWTKYIIQKGALEGLGLGVGVNYVSERLGQVGRRATAATYPEYTLVNAVLYYKVKDVLVVRVGGFLVKIVRNIHQTNHEFD